MSYSFVTPFILYVPDCFVDVPWIHPSMPSWPAEARYLRQVSLRQVCHVRLHAYLCNKCEKPPLYLSCSSRHILKSIICIIIFHLAFHHVFFVFRERSWYTMLSQLFSQLSQSMGIDKLAEPAWKIAQSWKNGPIGSAVMLIGPYRVWRW